jgi:hypothetical protein
MYAVNDIVAGSTVHLLLLNRAAVCVGKLNPMQDNTSHWVQVDCPGIIPNNHNTILLQVEPLEVRISILYVRCQGYANACASV